MKPFLRAWVCTSEESDGTNNATTKTIEDIEVEMVESELNLHVPFLGQVQDLLSSLSKLSSKFGEMGNTTISNNLGIINTLLLREDPGIKFEQENLIFKVYE